MKSHVRKISGLVVVVLAAPLLAAATAPPEHRTPKVQARRFPIEYQVNEAALPLSRVELWYTRDDGDTWHNYGVDEDCQSPIQFDAAEEGRYGFYFVVTNRMGTSGPPPQADTVPHEWAFVDYTPPIVQLHPVQIDQSAGTGPRLQIRWTAIDANFAPRPVELSYRLAPDGEWVQLVDRLSNTGRYDWAPPAQLEGRVVVRLTAYDRSAHRVSAVAGAVELEPVPETEQAVATKPPSGEQNIDNADLRRVELLLQRGIVHKDRGEYRKAAARFQAALAIKPQMPDVLVKLGETLYLQEEYADSIEAYELAVALEPDWTGARRGLANSLMAARRYADASAQLTKIVNSAPTDAAAWLAFGNVAMSRGDELMARAHWEKAASVDPKAIETIAAARARLENLRSTAVLANRARK